MSKEKLQNVNVIIDRAKKALEADTDADFARMIGILPSTLTNWRTRNTLNFPLLLSKCRNISLDWLITGTGEKTLPPEKLEQSSDHQPEQARICLVEHQIKELYNLFHEKIDQSPLNDQLVEIPLFIHSIPDDPFNCPEKIIRYMSVSKECIRDKNTSYAIRLQDNSMTEENFEQNDLLILDTGLPIKDHCIAMVTMEGKQSLKKLLLRQGEIFIAVSNGKTVPVKLGKDLKILGIVQKVVRELY